MVRYGIYTNQRSVNIGEDPISYLQSGSWIVGHFGAAGSQTMTDLVDDHVALDPKNKALLSKVGKYV